MTTFAILGVLVVVVAVLAIVLALRSGGTRLDGSADGLRDAGRPPESFRIPPNSTGGGGSA